MSTPEKSGDVSSAPARGPAFEALADGTRRAILSVLAARGELPVTEIAAVVDHVGRTSVSSHLRILRSAGLVNERRDGRFRIYSVDGTSVHDVVRFLDGLYRAPLDDLRSATGQRGGEAGRPAGIDP